jgi:hypothetical protein
MKRIAILLAVLALATVALAQDKPAATEAQHSVVVTHLVGMGAVPHNARGKLTVAGDQVMFTQEKGAKSEISIGSIEDVQTADDSKRLVGGVIGTLSMFGPYGSGRFLSLFRKNIDVLTVEYRDENGGLHGAIFTMPDGAAAQIKDMMVKAGAKAAPLPPAPAATSTEEKKQ